LGCKVRFDVGRKKGDFLVNTFGRWVQWVPVCPEVEVGMGTPRESIRLVRQGDNLRLLAPKSGTDWTGPMVEYSRSRVRQLKGMDLSGYVLKKDSPSCGMERVKVYGDGMPAKNGRGVFAEVLLAECPDLPVEEEGRLCDPKLRDNFVERVFAYHRVTRFFSGRWSLGALVAFHTAHKLQLMAHSQKVYRELGRLVAAAKGVPQEELAAVYRSSFMSGLKVIATTRRNTNVLQHMAGYLRQGLEGGDREELRQVIEEYRQGLIPLVVPMTLFRHHVRRQEIGYLQGQTYLEPHPRELMLRNHV
jgi:uncharacterized protein YbgA (DUF1722 family)/uncharacterized protein YbbK (DUF523 family)